jgi:hypothetical protein
MDDALWCYSSYEDRTELNFSKVEGEDNLYRISFLCTIPDDEKEEYNNNGDNWYTFDFTSEYTDVLVKCNKNTLHKAMSFYSNLESTTELKYAYNKHTLEDYKYTLSFKAILSPEQKDKGIREYVNTLTYTF